ncbi:MAG: hypothetical protein GX772_05765 [Alcaligenaceae bacterium]|nr:hypothetical protein [Alcaligenaceae bacterium]
MAFALLSLAFWGMPVQQTWAIHWHEPWAVQANGQHLLIETFTSKKQPDAVLRELVHTRAGYQRYLVGDGRILLSGVKPGEHWLAEIQAWQGGAQGYVSALYFEAARAHQLSAASGEPPSVSLHAAAQRRSDAGVGQPLSVFEFDDSAWVSVVALSEPTAVTEAAVSSEAVTLIPVDGQRGLALAVSIQEP